MTEAVTSAAPVTTAAPVSNEQNALNAIQGLGKEEQVSDVKPLTEPVKTETEKPKTDAVKPDLDQITEIERERFKQRRKFAEEKAKLVREMEELKKTQAPKQPEKQTTEQEEIDKTIKKLLMGEEEKPLSKKDIEQMFAEKERVFEEKQQQFHKQQAVQNAVISHKNKIAEHLKVNAEKAPLMANGMGDADDVYAVIEADYMAKVQEFDEEYANSHIMPIEKATQLAENYLASQMKSMLKSKSALTYLKGLISEIEGKPQNTSSSPRTLSDESFSNSAPSNGDDSEEARIQRAMRAFDAP